MLNDYDASEFLSRTHDIRCALCDHVFAVVYPDFDVTTRRYPPLLLQCLACKAPPRPFEFNGQFRAAYVESFHIPAVVQGFPDEYEIARPR
jgi:hypothetical protein